MTPWRIACRAAGWNGRSILVVALLAAAPGGAAAGPATREAWRKVEAGPVTVVGTASDAKLVETAVTIGALASILPGLVPGAFRAPPPIVVAVVHDAADLARAGFPPVASAEGRVVLASTAEEDARPDLLRAAAVALARRAKEPLPAWLVAGLAEYASTFSVSGARATLGRPVLRHVALLRAVRPDEGLFAASPFDSDDAASDLRRAGAWAVVHDLLHETPDGAGRLGRYAQLLAEGRDGASAFVDAFGAMPGAFLERACARATASRSLARYVPVPQGPSPGRILPLTRAGAAGILGGVVRGRRAPVPGRVEDAETAVPARPFALPPEPSPPSRRPPALARDVPGEVDAVNRLIDEGREEEALARLEALHASLAKDPEMQRALGWDVQEVRRVVVHNRLVRRYNEAIGLLNAGRVDEAVRIFREVAAKAEDPGLRRLAWERATAPGGGRR